MRKEEGQTPTGDIAADTKDLLTKLANLMISPHDPGDDMQTSNGRHSQLPRTPSARTNSSHSNGSSQWSGRRSTSVVLDPSPYQEPPPMNHANSAPPEIRQVGHRRASSGYSQFSPGPNAKRLGLSPPVATPTRFRASAASSSPTSLPLSKDASLSSAHIAIENQGSPSPKYITKLLSSDKTQALSSGKRIVFGDWIPGYLQPETRIALRSAMVEPISASDKPGYIYCYKIEGPNDPGYVHLKVGRAVKINERLTAWIRECATKHPNLRGWYPGPGRKYTQEGLLSATVDRGKPGRYCHKLERLVHLELKDLVASKVYLQPGFNDLETRKTIPPPSISMAQSAAWDLRLQTPCDCGTIHKEVFSFERATTSKVNGRQYELLVASVIQKWGDYLEEHF